MFKWPEGQIFSYQYRNSCKLRNLHKILSPWTKQYPTFKNLKILRFLSKLSGKSTFTDMFDTFVWKLYKLWKYIFAVVYGGGTPEPPPEIGKNVVENWCYPPMVYTFGKEAELQEILSKNCEKSQFSIEIIINKFQNFLHFWSKRARLCAQVP